MESTVMSEVKMQQIIVSGVGGQGVLFISKLLAETALNLGYSVLLSETHGMAQRGGNVISHLKVFTEDSPLKFTSPLIRPHHADILLGLHPDSMAAHGHFLKKDGTAFRNGTSDNGKLSIDATAIAVEMASPVSANLVMLGFAAASKKLFCSFENLQDMLKGLGGKQLSISLKALDAGRGKV
jgi:indolepyruvate ferredoxin oxidoreductase beta subunit